MNKRSPARLQGDESPHSLTMAELAPLPIWVAWRYEPQKGRGKPRKVPYDPKTGDKARGPHANRGGTRKAAERVAKRIGGQLGILTGPLPGHEDLALGGYDADAVIDPKTGKVERWAAKIETRFDFTASEESPSGTGFKGYFLYRPSTQADLVRKEAWKQDTGKAKDEGLELFGNGQFLALTERWRGDARTVELATDTDLRWLRQQGNLFAPRDSPSFTEDKTDVDEHNETRVFEGNLDQLRETLTYIDPVEHNSYMDWLKIISATHHESGDSEEGFEVAREWSEGCPDYDEGELRDKWESLGRGGGRHLTGAYLLKLAMQNEDFPRTTLEFEDLDKAEREAEPRKRSTLRIHSISDLKAMPPVKHLIRDVIEDGMLSSLIGTPGHGKTFAALDMLLHIATGKPWFGKTVEQGSVIHIALEGARGIWKRTRAWCEHHGVDANTLPIRVIDGTLNLRKDKLARQEIIDAARKLGEDTGLPVRAIVIDTLNRAMAGGNESASEDMGALIAGADHIRNATGAHIMLVHHFGKNTDAGARGHSSLFGAVDTEMTIENKKLLKITKQKEGEDNVSFGFRLEQVDLGKDDEGNAVTSAVVVHDSRMNFDDMGKDDMKESERIALHILRRMIDHARLIDGERDVALEKFRARIEAVLFRDKRDSARRMAWKRLIEREEFLKHAHIEGERIKCIQ